MTLDQLRRTEQLQAHHWKAAKWFAELPPQAEVHKTIAADCQLIHSRLNKIERQKKINVYKLLHRSCVARETIEPNELIIGVLRESLNAVFRAMCRQGKSFDGQTNT